MTNQLNDKKRLIEKFIASSETQSSKVYGKISILKAAYCETFDCENYFKGYEDRIIIYSKEDAFIRAITNSIIIESIDTNNRSIIITHRKKEDYKRERIVIKI